ncbi:hypothetical protein L2E82_31022 [Cichorium intybus]|uniref:Uncharacterized protein n=1 Tax=Cichorium intybus TaxID=13427 RepID=A0ACB9D1W2_CICIN|nr:hypothetical protein L2E82_31022 [Cichorium intybus]
MRSDEASNSRFAVGNCFLKDERSDENRYHTAASPMLLASPSSFCSTSKTTDGLRQASVTPNVNHRR